jgi:Glycosyl hydrolase catalytic core
MRALLASLCAVASGLALAAPADASRFVRFGVQDDSWLKTGPGLEERLERLDRLGVDVVRFTLHWNDIAEERPEEARSADDPAYEWGRSAEVLEGLQDHGIAALVTLYGTPEWANGGRTPNWAPTRGADFADFAAAASERFPWVRDWLIWNEPNQRRWLRPTSPSVYVTRLLNPAYAALHRVRFGVRVGAGATAPRGNVGGMSPVRWIRGMRKSRARLDAYAHHPYPLKPRVDTPVTGDCLWWKCETITMATLERLLTEVRAAWGQKRIWLTEYGYQTNPPDRTILGVSYQAQARYVSEAALRVWRAPQVDMLIQFLIQDDVLPEAWQSGLYTVAGKPKPSARAFPLPLAQMTRSGAQTKLWGQVRPRKGVQSYKLRIRRGGRWSWLGGVRQTDSHGTLVVTVAAPRGARVQLWSPRDRAYGLELTIS